MKKKALIVGINHYHHPKLDLPGCHKDANNMANLLSKTYDQQAQKYIPNFECNVLLSEADKNKTQVSRAALKREIKSLFSSDADTVLFYFSGHGWQTGLGGYLATQDAKSYDEGVAFNDIIILANQAQDKKVIIILDCCHSGELAKMPLQNSPISNLREGMSILTASTADQYSWGDGQGGVFTNLLCNGLKGGSADLLGNIDLVRLYRHAERSLDAWSQRPTLKVNQSKPVILRKVKPQLPQSVLEKLTEYFPEITTKIQLDPEFEPTAGYGNKKKEDQFANLQKMANVGLVKPVKQDVMYRAALREDQCELTPVGRLYWEVVHMGQHNGQL